MAEKLFRYRSVLFFLLYGIYILFLEDHITQLTRQANVEKITAPSMGYVLFLLQCIELPALWVKWKALKYRIAEKRFHFTGMILVWALHTVLSILLLHAAMNFFGINISTKSKSDSTAMYWYFLIVIKELIILFPMLPISLQRGAKKPVAISVEFTADLVLLIYTCIAYSVIWKADAQFSSSGTTGLFHGLTLTVLFVLLYVPMAFTEIVENLAYRKKRSAQIKLAFSIIFPVVCMHIDRLA